MTMSPPADSNDESITTDRMSGSKGEIGKETESVNVFSDVEAANSLKNHVPQTTRATMAALALALTSQDWSALGQGDDPNIVESSDLNITVERLVSLFLIRIVALVSHREFLAAQDDGGDEDEEEAAYSDLSTTTICKATLQKQKSWPGSISELLVSEVRLYVRRILEQYKSVHYHRMEHAYHVTISTNKLLDFLLYEGFHRRQSFREGGDGARPTYGLKFDPLSQLALLFSALVHDVEHKGISNRQLVLESDELALLYNDQSVAEQRSLAIAFSELMKDEFTLLRSVLFGNVDEEYRRFRKAVINLVLSTDIASPERTQLVKSKWKEAFGDTTETIERKERFKLSRRSLFQAAVAARASKRNSDSPDPSNRNVPSAAELERPKSQKRGSLVLPRVPRLRLRQMRKTASEDSSASPLFRSSPAGRINMSALAQSDELVMDPSSENYEQPKHLQASTGVIGSTLNNVDSYEETSPSVTPENSVCAGMEDSRSAGLNDDSSNTDSRDASLPLREGLEKLHMAEAPQIPPMRVMALPTSSDSYCSKSMRMDPHSLSDSGEPTRENLRDHLNRRFSSPDMYGKQVRIGIRRTLDLTGAAIENYADSTSIRAMSTTSLGSGDEMEWDADEPDELKATVLMEQILKAADVAPNLQGWDQLKKWSTRLFFELMESYEAGRGENPQNGWFENQITFLDSYTLPLARRLNDTEAFGSTIGTMFAQIVQENRNRWITDGLDLTDQVIQQWQNRHKNSGSSVL